MNRKNTQDIIVAFGFGIFSASLGMIKLGTPGFEGSYSDLREMALLISLFHIVNPLYILLLCAVSLLGLPFELRLIPIFLMHVVPLMSTWFVYKWIEQKQLATIKLGLLWFIIITVGYYGLLLYPTLIVTYGWVGIHAHRRFFESYYSLFNSGTFEMISTALVSSVYLIQFNIRATLEQTNKNLEKIVSQRTQELSNVNSELKHLNQNLEQKVRERTERIDSQLSQMIKYSHMNSHEVRAPLARILGLLQ
jgi:signal transduction histidine kinase